ncbi:hypothetical protein GEV33_005041 [Tenebrio molitor]|uniref:Tetraspanin n=1 Tax=Tenebrio molitor TaxID=7067 RepID=A0A8J6HP06_TENMO|nr:hypothetical protein GEV33_005041 [Tenebrio molitor]
MCAGFVKNIFLLILIALNLILSGISFTLLVMASVFLTTNTPNLDTHLHNICIVILMNALLLLLDTILGCIYGVYKQQQWSLRMYIYVLFFIAIFNIVLAVTTYTIAYAIDNSETSTALKLMFNSTEQAKDVAVIQQRCCGVDKTANATCKDFPSFKPGCIERASDKLKRYKIALSAVLSVTGFLTVTYWDTPILELTPPFLVSGRPLGLVRE